MDIFNDEDTRNEVTKGEDKLIAIRWLPTGEIFCRIRRQTQAGGHYDYTSVKHTSLEEDLDAIKLMIGDPPAILTVIAEADDDIVMSDLGID